MLLAAVLSSHHRTSSRFTGLALWSQVAMLSMAFWVCSVLVQVYIIQHQDRQRPIRCVM